jgi:hypothetical protein
MVARMKTTIELPDALTTRAKALAREQGLTLRELIEAGLRAELDRRARPADRPTFRLRTVGGTGLRVGVDPTDLRERAYDNS